MTTTTYRPLTKAERDEMDIILTAYDILSDKTSSRLQVALVAGFALTITGDRLRQMLAEHPNNDLAHEQFSF